MPINGPPDPWVRKLAEEIDNSFTYYNIVVENRFQRISVIKILYRNGFEAHRRINKTIRGLTEKEYSGMFTEKTYPKKIGFSGNPKRIVTQSKIKSSNKYAVKTISFKDFLQNYKKYFSECS